LSLRIKLIPGILNFVIDVSPKVISLLTVAELAAAKLPRIKLEAPVVILLPASLPIHVLWFEVVIFAPAL